MGLRAAPGQKRVDFRRCHGAVFPGFETREGQGAKGCPDELQNEVVQGLEKAAHLAVSALGQGNAVPGVRGCLSLGDELEGKDRPSVEPHVAPCHSLEMGRSQSSLDLHEIGSGDLESWVEDPLGEIAVVCEKECPFRLEVETSDMQDRVDPRKVVLEGRTPFRIEEGGDDPLGLVKEEEKGLRLPGKGTTVHKNLLRRGVDAGSRLGYDLPVDGDGAGGDQLLGFSSGGDSAVGEKLVEPETAIRLFLRVGGVVGAPLEVGTLGCHGEILYSHSIVEGGLGEMSKTTRLIPGTVAMMR